MQLFFHVYVLECLICNYSIFFQFERTVRRIHFQSRYIILSWLHAKVNLRKVFSRKVATTVNKSHGKTVRYNPCTFLISRAIQKSLLNLERTCRKNIYSDRHNTINICYSELFLRCQVSVNECSIVVAHCLSLPLTGRVENTLYPNLS